MRRHRRHRRHRGGRTIVQTYPYYGYGYPYNPYDYYWRQPEPEPPFVIVNEDDSDSRKASFLNKVNWPTVAATLALNAVLLLALRGGGNVQPR